MRLLSVNVGRERTIWYGETSGTTGIYKVPAAGPVRVTALGLEGDAVCDAKHHDGPDHHPRPPRQGGAAAQIAGTKRGGFPVLTGGPVSGPR